MSNNTIFDDVFRTLVEKMPQLTIPLINEIFGTNYPEDIEMEQRRNEHQTKDGEVITDSHLQIGEKSYHLECQSTKDSTMVIRMLEYDFAIALDSIDEESGKLRGYFPYSCVLYLRGKTGEATLEMELIMPDGKIVEYKVPILYLQKYTEDMIFQKNLFFLLPFYIMKYEKSKKELQENNGKLQEMLEEYRVIEKHLEEKFLDKGKEKEYRDIMELIIRTADYILKDAENAKKGLGEIMGGKVLELESDKLISQGIKRGIDLEKKNTEKERQRANAAEAEVARLKKLLAEKK